MKRSWIIGLALVAGVSVAIQLSNRSGSDAPPSPEVATSNSATPSGKTSTPAPGAPSAEVASAASGATGTLPNPGPPGDIPVPPPNTPPAEPVAPREEIQSEIENVQFAFRDFRTVLGENPIGNNSEITKALMGSNLKQVKIPVPTGSSVNANGEMCDRWGTPYFFHQLSAKEMEIHSAGPDRTLGTADDIVVK